MNKCIVIFLLLCSFATAQRLTKSEIALISSGNPESALPIYNISNQSEHKVLLNSSTDIKPTDKHTAVLIKRMTASLISSGGVGIAAPQVGINRNLVLAERYDKNNRPIEYFINPKITWRSKILNLGYEGDLSIDTFGDQFYRSQVIQIEYSDLQGNRKQELIEGFTAVILQHEIDHLSGILINDKIKQQNKSDYEEVIFYRIKSEDFGKD